MKKFLSIIIVLLLTGIGVAQDPGIPDTVNFGVCQSYIVGDTTIEGKVKVPLRIFNDEALGSIQVISLIWSGPLRFDTLVFYGQRADSADVTDYVFDNTERRIVIVAVSFSFNGMPSDTGLFLYMVFETFDTGMVKIDTVTPEGCAECPIYFVDIQTNGWSPLFEAKEFRLIKSDTIPGDLSGNNIVNLVDVVILINYLFKSLDNGFLKPSADVNTDCEINLIDIFYLVNYIFKQGEKPKPGCAWN